MVRSAKNSIFKDLRVVNLELSKVGFEMGWLENTGKLDETVPYTGQRRPEMFRAAFEMLPFLNLNRLV